MRRPLREEIKMPDEMFPIKVFVNSAIGPRVYVHPHWHEEIEILYVLSGHAVQQINKRFFSITKDDIVIVGSDEIHSTYTENDLNTDILVIQFKPSMLNTTHSVKSEDIILEEFCSRLSLSEPIKPWDTGSKELIRCLQGINREWESRLHGFEMLIKSEIYRFIGFSVRFLQHKFQIRKDSYKNRFVKTMLKNTFDLIDEKYSDNLSLDDAARASNLSVSHFCRMFKKCTGITFNDYLTRYRINMAEKILEKGENVTEAALQSGFNSINSFTRAYKRIKGKPPSALYKK